MCGPGGENKESESYKGFKKVEVQFGGSRVFKKVVSTYFWRRKIVGVSLQPTYMVNMEKSALNVRK